MRQLEVKGERGFEIRKRLDHEGNAVVAFASEAVEFKFSDHGGVLPRRQAGQQAGAPGFIVGGLEAPGAGARQQAGRSNNAVQCEPARARLPGRCDLR